jgi:hypothetical protein
MIDDKRKKLANNRHDRPMKTRLVSLNPVGEQKDNDGIYKKSHNDR